METMEERAEIAVDLKMNRGFNCAQAVTAALSDLVTVIETDLRQITAGFCAGMGSMEATCGALIGANIILGLATEGKGTLPLSRKLLEGFKRRCGALVCKDLKAIVDGKPVCPCADCVRNAVLALGDVLK